MENDKVATKPAYTVSQFINGLNKHLKRDFKIQGEVSEVSKYPSGIWFSLKDKDTGDVLKCSIWNNLYVASGVELTEGDEVILTGNPEIWGQKGTFTFKARTVEYAGKGQIKKAFEALKMKLMLEGLFAKERKRSIPKLPTKIGLVTSVKGAVLHDFSANLGKYGFKVTLVDTKVEGKDALHQIVQAIRTLKNTDIEVLVIIRGGGSLESFQAFNTEAVVREIVNFDKPVVTGVGHEVDVTLAELAADLGCSTPTATAEALSESWDSFVTALDKSYENTLKRFRIAINTNKHQIAQHEYFILKKFRRWLDVCKTQISDSANTVRRVFYRLKLRVDTAISRIISSKATLRAAIQNESRTIERHTASIKRGLKNGLTTKNEKINTIATNVLKNQKTYLQLTHSRLDRLETTIKIHDPERNLKLGYSLVFLNDKLLRSHDDVKIGDKITTRMSNGELVSEIREVK